MCSYNKKILETSENSVTKKIDIVHGEMYDVLVNLRHPDVNKVRSLSALVINGIPQSWQVLPQALGEKFNDEPPPPNVFVDDLNHPTFLAKVRKYAIPDRVRIAKMDAGKELSSLGTRTAYAFDSLLNEFALAPQVTETLKIHRAKEIAEKFGFVGIQFIEPLVGLIERSNGRKIMFYDYVDGDTTDYSSSDASLNRLKQLARKDQGDPLIRELVNLFKQNGIFPTDIGTQQLISSPLNESDESMLYLIDIEGFIRDAKREFTTAKASLSEED
jgi:hypothetical protein